MPTNIPQESKRTWIADLLLIMAIFIPLYLAIAPIRPLASPDEGRYTEIPREMAESGDWVSPRLNGMPYFYKPPFFYWVQAASIKAFGVNRFSARLSNSLAALFGIATAYCAARALRGRVAGFWAALILGSSALYYALGEIVTLDMTVSVFISAAMFSFIVAIKRSGICRGVLILSFFLFCALAVLTKGLIGVVIPAAIIFFWALFINPFKFFKMLPKCDILWILLGLILFTAVALPWHILAAIANPPYENAGGIFSKEWEGQGFFWYYIIHEHILRYIDPSTSMRAQPLWFFFVIAPVGFIPWIALMPQALRDSFKGGYKKMCEENNDILFCIIWVAFVILFFSASSSKLIPYIIPIFPAMAYIVAVAVAKIWNGEMKSSKAVAYALIFMGYVATIAPAIAYPLLLKDGKIPNPDTDMWVFVALSVVMFVGTTLTLLAHRKANIKAFYIGVFCSISALLAFVNPVGAIAQRPSAETLAKYYLENRKDGDVIFIAFDYGVFQDLPVWLGFTTYMIGVPPEEQKFGFMREREIHSKRFMHTEKAFKNFATQNKGDIYIASRDRDLERLTNEIKISTTEVARKGNLLLLKLKR